MHGLAMRPWWAGAAFAAAHCTTPACDGCVAQSITHEVITDCHASALSSDAMDATTALRPVGQLLREWRRRRRFSQLDLACDAGVSARHLSFIETGRSLPSREMLIRLAERLEVPLRERNALMISAGYAPIYAQRPPADDAMRAAREAITSLLSAHEPFPALAIDRHWTLVAANGAVQRLLAGVEPSLLVPPINVLRLSLHPAGLAPRILNFQQWRAHLLERLGSQVAATADAELIGLLRELHEYPATAGALWLDAPASRVPSFVVPLRLATQVGVLSMISTTTVFGTPVEVTLSELAIESFFPADAVTGEMLHALARHC